MGTDDIREEELESAPLSSNGDVTETNLFGGDAWFQIESRKRGRELENYVADIAESVRVAMDQSISILTPWFFSNLPQFYYQTTPRAEKIRDLHAVITGHIFDSRQKLQLWNRERTKTTFLAPGSDEGIFQDIAASLSDLNIKHGYAFTSNDGLLLIASFFTDQYQPVNLENPKNRSKIDKAVEMLSNEDPVEVKAFMEKLDNDAVIHATHARLCRLFKLFKTVKEREDAETHLIPKYHMGFARFDIAYKKMPMGPSIGSVLSLFDRYGFHVARCNITVVNQQTDVPVGIMTFIIEHESRNDINERFVPFLKVNKALKTLKWVDSDEYDTLLKPREEMEPFSLNEINLVRSISDWIHIFLSKLNPYYYSEERIRKTFLRHPNLLKDLLSYFRHRFDPRLHEERGARVSEILERVSAAIGEVDNRIELDILQETLSFLSHILKTNYFYPRKTGLAFRMNPACLNPKYYPNRPFGFFYLVGRGYRGFHVRFRDTSRGGMRIVMPHDSSQFEVSFAGLFDEVIGLAYAQQMKNKDIPEGGAKAVLLLKPGADRETAAIGAVDSMLNLITVDLESGKLDPSIIDYFGEEENVYLGPDENCTNELINKFVSMAAFQGYRYPNAFMSSKPDAGINHKVYGVTSEGVNVFLDNLLRELKIDPAQQTFTVKMTGGPDGDVAGNELKILHREYGENARVVAIADGFGAAHDPRGLDWTELLRLVREGLPVDHFNRDRLHDDERAFVIKADNKENVRVRNTLHARVDADILIPAGGRPYTVNSDNWHQYLGADGKPTTRGIVEGANIFFTDDARQNLQDQGILIFKDSSANKCGVICSSFEILSALILSPQEFLEIKEEYVQQVLVKLREKADKEAKLLLREYHERGAMVNLVDLSKVLSKVINRVTDLVASHLEALAEDSGREALFDQLVMDYAPQILVDRYRDRLLSTHVPRSYRQALISAELASRLVYAEGISWLEHLPDERVVDTVLIYMEKQSQVLKIMQSLQRSRIGHKEEIAQILSLSGARTLTKLASYE